jgi:hypothetical protein
MGDIVRVRGADLSTYNGVVLFAHGHTPAVNPAIGKSGKIRRTKLENGVLAMRADSFEFGTSDLAREVREAWDGGILNSTSIGFQPVAGKVRIIDEEGKPAKDYDDALADFGFLPPGYGREFLGWELLEWSIVPVPANPDAAKELRGMPSICKALDWERPATVTVPSTFSVSPPLDAGTWTVSTANGVGISEFAVTGNGITESVDQLGHVARAIRDTSVEPCPACEKPEPYHRPTAKFLNHAAPDGKPCHGEPLTTPRGLTFKRFADLLGNLHDVRDGFELLLSRGAANLDAPVLVGELASRLKLIESKAGDLDDGERESLLTSINSVRMALDSASDFEVTSSTSDTTELEALVDILLERVDVLQRAAELVVGDDSGRQDTHRGAGSPDPARQGAEPHRLARQARAVRGIQEQHTTSGT